MKEAKGGTELTGERVRRAINACGIGVFAATEDGRVGAARAAESCLYSGARTHRTGGFEFGPDFVGGRLVTDGARNYRYILT